MPAAEGVSFSIDAHLALGWDPMLGTTVSHYRLIEKLGEGGMGEVWVAEDETLHRRVALKAIRADRRLNPRSRARFLREARILSQLDHPHICRIHDYVEGDGRDYLVLELVEGADLHAAILDGLDRAAVLDIVDKVNGALVAAHAAGVVHRDLKPANVMLTPDRGVKVLDFGLAATVDAEPVDREPSATFDVADDLGPNLTQEGATVGTLRYMSPEQARGEPATAASDMYSLGLVLVELLAGHPAFPPHRDVDALLAHVQRGATVPPSIRSTELGRLAEKLLDPAPTRRPTAVDVADRLRWIRERPRRVTRRVLTAAVLAAAALGGVKYTIDLGHQRTNAESARRRAEDLVDFMLGKLHGELLSVGRLDALADTADKVLVYLEQSRGDGFDAAAAFRRARALIRIGQVRFEQHRLTEARALFEEAREGCARLCAADSSNTEWKLELAAAEFWIGYVHLQQDDIAGATEYFTKYREYARELVAADPENPTFQEELGYAHTNLLKVYLLSDETAAAVAEARGGLEVKQALFALDPSDAANQRMLALGLGWLAIALEKDGKYEEALARQGEALALHRKLVDSDPKDTSALEQLSNALSWQADLFVETGQDEAALTLYLEDLALARQLVALEPANAEWRRGLALSRRKLAGVELRTGRSEEAERLLRLSHEGYEQLHALDPDKQIWSLELANCHELAASLCLARGDADGAIEGTAAALALIEHGQGAGGDASEELVATHARILLRRGEAYSQRGGGSEEARKCWQAAHDLLASSAEGAEDPDSGVLFVWIEILVALGRAEEAEPYARRLAASGYARRDFKKTLERLGWNESDSSIAEERSK